VKSMDSISEYKKEYGSGVIDAHSGFTATSLIKSNLTLINFQQIESPKRLENGLYELKGYVCNSNVAKPYIEKQRILSDEMGIAKDWNKIKNNWNEFSDIQILLEVLRVESKYFASAKKIYEKARDDYKANCKAKLHWKPQRKSTYSDIAFSKLSSIGMETSDCKGKGIMLVYSGSEPECKSKGGPWGCTYKPSLRIISCNGTELGLLENQLKEFGSKEDIALKNLQDKLKIEDFWNEWKQEIKQWSPQCEQ
jgi:hypothetical protein